MMVGNNQFLVLVVLLSNAITPEGISNPQRVPNYIERLGRFDQFEGSGDEVTADLRSIKETLSNIEDFENLALNEIEVKNEEYLSRYSRKLDIFNTTDTPKLKFLIPTEQPKILQRLKLRKGRKIGGGTQLIEEVENIEDDDIENKKVDDMLVAASSTIEGASSSHDDNSRIENPAPSSEIEKNTRNLDILFPSENKHESTIQNEFASTPNNEHIETVIGDDSTSTKSPLGNTTSTSPIDNDPASYENPLENPKVKDVINEQILKYNAADIAIETDEGSGSDVEIKLPTEGPKPSVLTADMLEFIENASTEGTTSTTPTPNFVEQNYDTISTASILEETAESLVASSEQKPMPTLPVEAYQSNISKSGVLVVAGCVSGIVLLAIIGLVYVVNFQKQTGTLDIEMQERRCGKDSYEDEDVDDGARDQLLGATPVTNTVTVADDTL